MERKTNQHFSTNRLSLGDIKQKTPATFLQQEFNLTASFCLLTIAYC
jgi:hypothetical protein